MVLHKFCHLYWNNNIKKLALSIFQGRNFLEKIVSRHYKLANPSTIVLQHREIIAKVWILVTAMSTKPQSFPRNDYSSAVRVDISIIAARSR